MPLTSFHRLLPRDETPVNQNKRIWVLSGGNIQDWYFHNQLHGCVSLRRTIELWALEHDMLTMLLTGRGSLDFSGNPDPDAAQARFESCQPRRRQAYSHRPAATDKNIQPDDETSQRASQARSQVEQDAGGQGRSHINTIQKITNFLKNRGAGGVVLVEDFAFFLDTLQSQDESGNLPREICHTVTREWHREIRPGKLLVFIEPEKEKIEAILPPAQYPDVIYRDTRSPCKDEIREAIERLTARRGVEIHGTSVEIAEALANQEKTLKTALWPVIRNINKGAREVSVNTIMNLPEINEEEVQRILAELNALAGLTEVKEKAALLEGKARRLRRDLEEGRPILQNDTMHLMFIGSPGTGKTMVANIFARLFHALGFLRKDTVRDIRASTVISQYQGESRLNMAQIVEETRGGVLFIDEAHQLGDKESQGTREVISELVPAAWNYRSDLVIILAGYDRFADFFAMDEGLERRFPSQNRILFKDYSLDELWQILLLKLRKLDQTIDPSSERRLRAVLRQRGGRRSFGNAGGVDLLVSELLDNQTRNGRTDRLLTAAEMPPLIRVNQQVLDEAYAEMDRLKGLAPVRSKIENIVNTLRYRLENEEHGIGSGELELHPGNMRFVGPPGTGKTTVGQLIGKILFGLGCVNKPGVMIAGRGTMKGSYIGQSKDRVKEAVNQARDGVLFIDEAHQLAPQLGRGEIGDQYDDEIRGELVRQVTLRENDATVFILAGYQEGIERLLETDPGLTGRVPVEITFPNFSATECRELALELLERDGFTWAADVPERLEQIAASAIFSQGDKFGNARWVKNLLKEGISNLATRIISTGISTGDPTRKQLAAADFLRSEGPVGRAPAVRASSIDESLTPWTPVQDYVILPATSGGQDVSEATRIVAESSHQLLVYINNARGVPTGTGFFVTRDGIMATAGHMLENIDQILHVVCLCGGRDRMPRRARPVLIREDLDLALLAVDVDTPCPAIPLANSLELPALRELVVFGTAHVRPGEPGRFITAQIARNENTNDRDFETAGAMEPGFSGGPVYDPVQGGVVGIVSGGYGESSKIMIRAERLGEMLETVGYRFR
ncbi:MAG: AAA family ATPase [Desulforudis sp.]|jgi:SpoVK/Ycf46/Vps4 family AAA+-type ATPase/S1-C subfamily serine protease|nr:MAG: AAA family ATPase [Desulforudis sp.]